MSVAILQKNDLTVAGDLNVFDFERRVQRLVCCLKRGGETVLFVKQRVQMMMARG